MFMVLIETSASLNMLLFHLLQKDTKLGKKKTSLLQSTLQTVTFVCRMLTSFYKLLNGVNVVCGKCQK